MSTVVVGQLLKSCKVARHSADWLRSPAPFLWSISLTGTVWWKSVRWRKHWRQDSRECQSKALWKKYVLSLDLNLDSESQRIIVSGNEFQTVSAEQRKARFVKSVLVNGLSSSGVVKPLWSWSRLTYSLTMSSGFFLLLFPKRSICAFRCLWMSFSTDCFGLFCYILGVCTG